MMNSQHEQQGCKKDCHTAAKSQMDERGYIRDFTPLFMLVFPAAVKDEQIWGEYNDV